MPDLKTKATQLTKGIIPGSISVSKLSFNYTNSAPLLKGVNLKLSPGKWISISGESGSGKTTLAMSLNGLVPHATGGHIGGTVKISGVDPRELGPAEMSKYVGFLFQETASSYIGNTIEREIAFSLEQQGISHDQMESEINHALKVTNTEEFRFRSPQTLSGGERQRCAIAAVLALRPSVLILDEPTAQLDPSSKEEIITLIDKIRKEEGTSIVWIEQPCAQTSRLSDSLWVLKEGKLVADTPKSYKESIQRPKTDRKRFLSDEILLQVTSVSFHFPKSPELIKNLSFSIHKGELIFLKGVNGSGKTTLFRLIMGLEKPLSGDIQLSKDSILAQNTADRAKSLAYLMQEPDQQLFASSVKEELMSGILYHTTPSIKELKERQQKQQQDKTTKTYRTKRSFRKKELEQIKKRAEEMASIVAKQAEISDYWNDPPQQLSYGFRKRVALAAIATTRPDLYLLDEPTVALDQSGRKWLKKWIKTQQQNGASFLIISHDEEFIAASKGHTLEMELINDR